MQAPLLQVDKVSKHFKTGERRLDVLREVSFEVNAGDVVALVGESGTGKSTLLHILGTLDKPSSGRVLFKGDDVAGLDDPRLAAFRNRSIGFVFQFHHLLPEFTALENVAMPALIQNQPLREVRERASSLLEIMGLADRADHHPAQLSGGERQRVAVARALMNGPDLILADEPTGNLDTRTAETLHEEFLRLNQTLGQTFVVATHNPHLAERAQRVFRLEEGLVFET